MPLDAESQELIKRLQDIEDRLLSDKLIEKTIYDSIKNLEKVFGKKSVHGESINRLKIKYNFSRLKSIIRNAIRKTDTSITSNKASAGRENISIYKNSILSNFLADNKRISHKKLRELHRFFAERGTILKNAFEKGNPEEIKKVLKEYIGVLESEERYLKENQYMMVEDIKYAFSLYNLMVHEISHWAFKNFSKTKFSYQESLNEGYSFAIQKLLHTYNKEHIWTEENLSREIYKLYRLIIPRKHVYPSIQYLYMKPFILLISILILCDSIARKDRDYRNKGLFLQSYSCHTLGGIFKLIEESISNLKNEEFKQVIRNTILKTALNQLRKCKEDVVNELKLNITLVADFEKPHSYIHRILNKETKFKDKLTKIIDTLENRSVVVMIDLLRIMGYENEASIYRDEYLKVLVRTINNIIKDNKDLLQSIYQNEKNAIEGILSVIREEDEIIIKIVEGLKF